MRDVLPAEKAKRDAVLATIRATYRRFGFQEIETPALEPLSRLRSNQGGENESMLFEVLKRGLDRGEPIAPSDATDLALRYDLTVPLTRFYASHQATLPAVFRALQIGTVWRAERPQKGRYRQFYQCDIDVIGEPGTLAEVDLLVSTLAAFDALGMGEDVTLLVNDRRVLHDLMTAAGVPEQNAPDALIALDKLDKIGVDGVVAELEARDLAPRPAIDTLMAAITALQTQGSPSDAPLMTGSFEVAPGRDVSLRELPEIVAAVVALRPDARVVFDASLVRGMGYYTGAIFEIRHEGSSGSVAGGGRYDGVVGKWLGREVPACGFSIGFERIIDLVPDQDAGRRRIALFYADDAAPTDLLALRSRLLGDSDAEVSLVKPPRKTNARFMDQLVEDGFTHVCDARRAPEDAGDPEVRELRR